MPDRRPGSSWTRGAVVCALLVVVAGCGKNPVVVEQPRLSTEDAAACQALLADLPDLLHDEERRLVAPAAAPGAAWGDPAIVLQCGAPLPEDLDALSPCLEANGVGWFLPPEAETDLEDGEEAGDVTIAAAGYRPVVTVLVPGDYRPEGIAAVTAGLASAVEDNLDLVQPCA